MLTDAGSTPAASTNNRIKTIGYVVLTPIRTTILHGLNWHSLNPVEVFEGLYNEIDARDLDHPGE